MKEEKTMRERVKYALEKNKRISTSRRGRCRISGSNSGWNSQGKINRGLFRLSDESNDFKDGHWKNTKKGNSGSKRSCRNITINIR